MNHDHELVEIGDVKAVDKVEQALRSNFSNLLICFNLDSKLIWLWKILALLHISSLRTKKYDFKGIQNLKLPTSEKWYNNQMV
jgi:hypothetical protein